MKLSEAREKAIECLVELTERGIPDPQIRLSAAVALLSPYLDDGDPASRRGLDAYATARTAYDHAEQSGGGSAGKEAKAALAPTGD